MFFKRPKMRNGGGLPSIEGHEGELRPAIDAARACPEAMAAVERLYSEVSRAVADRKPVCSASGRCCRFEEYGHRMYVSTIELARFVADLEAAGGISRERSWDGTGCPFQVDGLCGVHAIRPLGCRTFYCDPTSSAWQNELYERHHAVLRTLHDRFEIPYRYVEWRAALVELDWQPAAGRLGVALTVAGRPLL